MAKIGFIGTGEIAECMVRGLVGRDHQIYVSERNAERAKKICTEFKDVSIADNQMVIDKSDYVCLCLMKDTAFNILPSLSFKKGQKVISAMVDVNIQNLTDLCRPANDICITIPLPFIATGKCPLPVYPDTGSVCDIFGESNIILPVTSERSLNAYFGASALASAIFTQMQAGSNWLGGVIEDKARAEIYTVAMFGGYISSLEKDGQERITEALQSLSTEGGLNATLRKHVETEGVLDTITDGLDGLKKRLGLEE